MARLLLLLFLANAVAFAEEVPLQDCDKLPVVQVSVSGKNFLFLVDTAATSMLNLGSFGHGDALNISVTSWSGTADTRAQEVTLGELVLGDHHFKDLKLPAIDLSAIGRACGRPIDGVFGVDLLRRWGATVDLKNHLARLPSDDDSADAQVAELHRQLLACQAAFNRADEITFADCLDPNIVLFASAGDFYGRDAAMQYYRQKYFQQHPPAQLSITPRAHHHLGDAIWVEYDLRIEVANREILARGSALCQKTDKWRIVHMNHSSPPPEAVAAAVR
ncbi:MAG TPA: nuclear transport factor 2 family protein [Terriglobales bacterium]|nr:nuclear transport factor 2 family protein [Terriglobales bacterium]